MKEIKKFCLPNRLKTILIMIPIFAAVYVIGLIAFFFDDDIDDPDKEIPIYAVILLIIMIIIFGVIFYEIAIKPHIKFNKRLKYFNRNNMTQYIISDFRKGIRMFNNNVIVGEYCLIGKREGLIVFYNEIQSFYCFVKRDVSEEGHVSVSKSLKIVGGGKEYLLCDVSDWSISEPEYIQLCAFLKIKNPSIVIK